MAGVIEGGGEGLVFMGLGSRLDFGRTRYRSPLWKDGFQVTYTLLLILAIFIDNF